METKTKENLHFWGLRAIDVAKEAGVSQQFVYDVFKGNRRSEKVDNAYDKVLRKRKTELWGLLVEEFGDKPPSPTKSSILGKIFN